MVQKVSIIIPVFNVEAFLRQCLDSIGLFGRDDIEIILVNDGSTDNSDDICREYLDKWNNVKLIEKQNGGLSDARNWGTKEASGEYICYLDSDDWLVTGAIETLYDFAKANNCDVVQGGFYYAYDDHLEYDDSWIEDDQKPFVLDRDEAMLELIKNNYIKNFAWGKLYKSSIVKSHQFPVGKLFEDSYWQHLVMFDTNRYGVIPAPLYFYRQRSDSISGNIGNKLLQLLEGNEQRLLFIRDNYPRLTGVAADFLWRLSFDYQKLGPEFTQFFNEVNNKYTSLLSDHFKRSFIYRLAVNNSPLLPLYLFAKRVKDHFNPIKRIELTK